MRLIDADALIFTRPKDRIPTEGYIEVSDIDRAKTIDPVKHGKWEVVDEAEPRRYGCSECKRLSYTQYNYCPNCGASMDMEDE